MDKFCKHGHPLVPGNITGKNECLICAQKKEPKLRIANKDKKTCPYGHPLTGANVTITIDKYGHRRRKCNTCHAERCRGNYWNRLKPVKHPRNKPGRPRKY